MLSKRADFDRLPPTAVSRQAPPTTSWRMLHGVRSYLAGERWSDRPACTHPLLSLLARKVNDHISDDARQGLVGLVPDVIGLTGADVASTPIALRAARTALPVVAAGRQRVMAVGVLTSERVLADLNGCADAPMSEQSRDALARSRGCRCMGAQLHP